MDHVVFEEVDESVPSTNLEMPGELLDEPVNLSLKRNYKNSFQTTTFISKLMENTIWY